MLFFKSDVCKSENAREINKMKAVLRNNSFVQEVLRNVTPESLKEPGIVKIRCSNIEGKWANCRYSDYGLKDLSWAGCGAFARLIYEKIKSIEPNTEWEMGFYEPETTPDYYYLQKRTDSNLKDW